MDPVVVMAQEPERRPVPELAKSFFEKTVSQPYTYKVGSRRDPFVPLQFSGSPDDSDATEQLDSGNADGEVTLLGIISGKRGFQALLKLPNGKRVIVGPGSYLQNTTGRVKGITRDTVVIARSTDAKHDNHKLEQSFVLSHKGFAPE